MHLHAVDKFPPFSYRNTEALQLLASTAVQYASTVVQYEEKKLLRPVFAGCWCVYAHFSSGDEKAKERHPGLQPLRLEQCAFLSPSAVLCFVSKRARLQGEQGEPTPVKLQAH